MELSAFLWIVSALLAIYYLFFRQLSHFQKLNIPHVKPLPFFGNMAKSFFRLTPFSALLQNYYNQFPRCKYVGFHEFQNPVLMVRDPELFMSIAVKNFEYFADHRHFLNEKLEPLMGRNLFALRGTHWREMRKVVSPTFTTSKLKNMFVLINDCAENFADFIANEAGRLGGEYEMKKEVSKYANDVVATCAFGVSVDSMRNPNNEFYVLARKTMNFEGILSTKFFFIRNFPTLATLLGVRLFGDDITNFFTGIVAETVKMREEKGIVRPDMIQLMLEASKEHSGFVDIHDITAQAFVFFFAGFDGTSTFMSFLAHELAMHKDVQETLVREIEEVIKSTNGKPSYDAIVGMKYLDAVVNEVLRLYPIGSFIDRVSVKDFEMPPATDDGKPITIPTGTAIWFPVHSIHRDPTYYPNPDKFDPSRFLDGTINQSVYFPFGLGPRICIGNRFALLVAKTVIFRLLTKCELDVCGRTNIPMKLSTKSFIMLSKGGFWLNIRERERKLL